MKFHDLESIPTWEWPPDAAEIILEVLQDRRAVPTDRLSASQLAGDIVVIDDRLANALLHILVDGNETETLRAQAAISFGPVLELTDDEVEELDEWDKEMGPDVSPAVVQKIRQTLHQVFLDALAPKLVRRRALEGSIRSPQEWHKGAVRTAYADADADWRLTAVFCMEFIGGFESEILESLDSPDKDVRFHAVVAAGNWQVEEAWEHVARLTSAGTTDKDLLLAAIEAVANIRPHKARAILGPLLESDDEEIYGAVNEALEYVRITGRLDREPRSQKRAD
jgi:HEAT repeat protein